MKAHVHIGEMGKNCSNAHCFVIKRSATIQELQKSGRELGLKDTWGVDTCVEVGEIGTKFNVIGLKASQNWPLGREGHEAYD